MARHFLSLCMVCLFLLGCEINDSDKCVDDLDYDDDLGVCVGEEEGTDTTDSDAALDGGPVDSGQQSDPGEDGIGEFCTEQAHCASFEASYCVLDPMTGEGACTIPDCPENECPEGFVCCDCPEYFGWPTICVERGSTGDLESFQCVCE